MKRWSARRKVGQKHGSAALGCANRDPRAAAQIPLHNASEVKARLAQDTDHTLAETVNSGRLDTSGRTSPNAPR